MRLVRVFAKNKILHIKTVLMNDVELLMTSVVRAQIKTMVAMNESGYIVGRKLGQDGWAIEFDSSVPRTIRQL